MWDLGDLWDSERLEFFLLVEGKRSWECFEGLWLYPDMRL